MDAYSCRWDCWSLELPSVPAASDVTGHAHCQSKASPLTGDQSKMYKKKKKKVERGKSYTKLEGNCTVKQ